MSQSQSQSSTGGSATATGGNSEGSSSSYSSVTVNYGGSEHSFQAPEISGSGAVAAITILLIGLAIIVGRPKR